MISHVHTSLSVPLTLSVLFIRFLAQKKDTSDHLRGSLGGFLVATAAALPTLLLRGPLARSEGFGEMDSVTVVDMLRLVLRLLNPRANLQGGAAEGQRYVTWSITAS